MNFLKNNVGAQDRKIRLGVGAVLVVLSLFNILGALWFPALIIGGILLATGFMKSCPVYTILGKNTLGK